MATRRGSIFAVMVLNAYERWLLWHVGLRGRRRRDLFAVLLEGRSLSGDVDVTAQEGNFKLAKRSVVRDREPMYDRIMSPYELSVNKVVYGHRGYKWPVIAAAALHQAGISAEQFRSAKAHGGFID